MPAGAGAGTLAEGELDGGRELLLGLHGEEEALGGLLGAAEAGLGRGDGVDPFGEFAAGGFGEGVVPGTEGGVFVEERGEFVGQLGGAVVEIGLEVKDGLVAGVHGGGGLHGAVDE